MPASARIHLRKSAASLPGLAMESAYAPKVAKNWLIGPLTFYEFTTIAKIARGQPQ
jgi:hypothetical protein